MNGRGFSQWDLMEGKAGFKECPRCGLRNRRFVLRCDFCGFEFAETDEEWTDYLDILERLGKTEESEILDEKVTRRIEATIVRSRERGTPEPSAAEPLQPEIGKEAEEEAESGLRGDSRVLRDETEELRELISTMVGGTVAEPDIAGTAREPAPGEEGTLDESGIEPVLSGEVAEQVAGRPTVAGIEQTPPVATTMAGERGAMPSLEGMEDVEVPPEGAATADAGLVSSTTQVGSMLFTGFLITGIAIYLAIMLSGALIGVSSAVGWAGALIGAIMIVLGFGRFLEMSAPRSAK